MPYVLRRCQAVRVLASGADQTRLICRLICGVWERTGVKTLKTSAASGASNYRNRRFVLKYVTTNLMYFDCLVGASVREDGPSIRCEQCRVAYSILATNARAEHGHGARGGFAGG